MYVCFADSEREKVLISYRIGMIGTSISSPTLKDF